MKINGIETDLLEQFRDRPNTAALCAAINKQLNALAEVFEQIAYNTNIDTATGRQLDNIGDIVGLTRAEAGLLCGQSVYYEPVDDERYRRYLKYKAFQNSSDGTYYSLVKAMQTILGRGSKIDYVEDENYPATIIFDIGTGATNELSLSGIPPIKPAGVSVEYKVDTKSTIELSHEIRYYIGGVACGTLYCGQYPADKPFPRCGSLNCGEYPPEGI